MIAIDKRFREFDTDPDTQRMMRAAAGDRDAFDELFERYFTSTVRIIASMLGSMSSAEDLAQDVFLRLYRSRERYVPTAKFSTFLGTIIRNTVLNEKRRLSRQRVSFTQFVDGCPAFQDDAGRTATPMVEEDLAHRLDQQQTRTTVHQAMSQLPCRQRLAIELVHFQGKTYVAAARELETSRKAVKSLLGRGKQALAIALRDHDACLWE